MGQADEYEDDWEDLCLEDPFFCDDEQYMQSEEAMSEPVDVSVTGVGSIEGISYAGLLLFVLIAAAAYLGKAYIQRGKS